MKIFLIAGEASGDALGAKLMSALNSRYTGKINFLGVGGDQMEKLGLKTLFPMSELSLIGFVEILPHIPRLLRRIDQVAQKIMEEKPDVVITIDAPAFNNRVARKLNEMGARKKGIKLVHYVAPTVWAYKPERAEKISKLYDHLLLLLPFEPLYFEKAGLPCTFVGHPIIEENIAGGNGADFRKQHNIRGNQPVLCVLPGSRKGELKRLLPIFKKSISILREKFPDLFIIIVAAPGFENRLKREFKTQNTASKTLVISDKNMKKDAYAASNAALVKSGTGSLEVAIAGVPMVIAYKVNRWSARMLRKMIMVKYVNLVNIILNKEAIPELLQENCRADKLAENIEIILSDKSVANHQLEQVKIATNQLSNSNIPPSQKAAGIILDLVASRTIQ